MRASGGLFEDGNKSLGSTKKVNFVPFRFIIRAGARQDRPLLITSVLKMISLKHKSSGYFVSE